MSVSEKIQDNKCSILINTSASFVLGVVLLQSIEIVFCQENRRILDIPVIYALLHSVLVINLVVDWISAIVKSSREEGLSILTTIGFVLLLVIEGYICILAFDADNTISLIIFTLIVFFSVLYDFYLFIKNSQKSYGVFAVVRLFLFLMLLLAYISLRLAEDIEGILAIMAVYIVAKILRLFFVYRQEITQ